MSWLVRKLTSLGALTMGFLSGKRTKNNFAFLQRVYRIIWYMFTKNNQAKNNWSNFRLQFCSFMNKTPFRCSKIDFIMLSLSCLEFYASYHIKYEAVSAINPSGKYPYTLFLNLYVCIPVNIQLNIKLFRQLKTTDIISTCSKLLLLHFSLTESH